MFNRRLLLISAPIIIVLVTVGAILTSFLKTRQTVTVNIHNGVTAEIYPSEQNSQNAVHLATLTQSGAVQLPKGSYVALSRETTDYADFSVQFLVDNKPVTIDINPPYSTKKLASLTIAAKAEITPILTSAFPKINVLYSIEDGWLYNQGEWYATKLDYKGPAGQYPNDSLRVIMHKENGGWKIATNLPDIIISSPRYPNIPRDVVGSINAK